RRRPDRVFGEAEILDGQRVTVARTAHRRGKVAVAADSGHPDRGLMDVDPVVGKGRRAVERKLDADMMAVAQVRGGLLDIRWRRRIELGEQLGNWRAHQEIVAVERLRGSVRAMHLDAGDPEALPPHGPARAAE